MSGTGGRAGVSRARLVAYDVLRDVEDLSIEEICEITGLPDGTVKSRLHRARLALRKKLQRHVD